MTRDEEQGHAERGPPTRLIGTLRRHRPVSFGSLTLRLFLRRSIWEHLTSYSLQTYWSQFDDGRMPPWNSMKLLLIHFDPDSFHFTSFDSISSPQQKGLKNRRRDWVSLRRGDETGSWRRAEFACSDAWWMTHRGHGSL